VAIGDRIVTDVLGAIFNFLDYLSAEVAINANLYGWKPTVEFGEGVWQNAEARCFVGTDRERATRASQPIDSSTISVHPTGFDARISRLLYRL